MKAAGIILLLAVAATTSATELTIDDEFQFIHTGPGLSLHKGTWMLPVTWSDEYNGSQTEAVFQLSAKHRIFGSRFYFAYTQISYWQSYDIKGSAPFRDTNYNPEIFYRFSTRPWRDGRLGMDVGGEHESNGQVVPLSRSWNQVSIAPYFWRPGMLIYLKLRWRIPEEDKENPADAIGDDNPGITDHYGYSDLHGYFRVRDEQFLHVLARGNPATGHGFVAVEYSLPIPHSEGGFLMLRLTHGYGESLMDYDRSINRVGIGVTFVR